MCMCMCVYSGKTTEKNPYSLILEKYLFIVKYNKVFFYGRL